MSATRLLVLGPGACWTWSRPTRTPAGPDRTAYRLTPDGETEFGLLLGGQRASARDLLENGSGWGQPEHVGELYRLWLASMDATDGWLRELVVRLESGGYVMADDGETAFGTPTRQV